MFFYIQLIYINRKLTSDCPIRHLENRPSGGVSQMRCFEKISEKVWKIHLKEWIFSKFPDLRVFIATMNTFTIFFNNLVITFSKFERIDPLRKKCPNTEFFSGPNTGIYEPGKTPYLHTFYAVDHKMKE